MLLSPWNPNSRDELEKPNDYDRDDENVKVCYSAQFRHAERDDKRNP